MQEGSYFLDIWNTDGRERLLDYKLYACYTNSREKMLQISLGKWGRCVHVDKRDGVALKKPRKKPSALSLRLHIYRWRTIFPRRYPRASFSFSPPETLKQNFKRFQGRGRNIYEDMRDRWACERVWRCLEVKRGLSTARNWKSVREGVGAGLGWKCNTRSFHHRNSITFFSQKLPAYENVKCASRYAM